MVVTSGGVYITKKNKWWSICLMFNLVYMHFIKKNKEFWYISKPYKYI